MNLKEYAALVSKPRANKYRNKPQGRYASKREADRALALHLMQEAGQIRNLREQVEYVLIPKQEGERACTYTCDFQYEEFPDWKLTLEDVKGYPDQKWPIKRKLMLWVHKLRVKEIK